MTQKGVRLVSSPVVFLLVTSGCITAPTPESFERRRRLGPVVLARRGDGWLNSIDCMDLRLRSKYCATPFWPGRRFSRILVNRSATSLHA